MIQYSNKFNKKNKLNIILTIMIIKVIIIKNMIMRYSNNKNK